MRKYFTDRKQSPKYTGKQKQAKTYTARMAEIVCIFLEYSGKIHEKLVTWVLYKEENQVT